MPTIHTLILIKHFTNSHKKHKNDQKKMSKNPTKQADSAYLILIHDTF